MQFGHAVDVMRTDDGEVRHADALRVAFLDDRELGLAGVVARPAAVDLFEVTAVDLVDDLEMAREHLLEERHRPGLEGLRQQGVVGVAEDLRAKRPSFVPSQALDVDQEAHQFGYGDRRVGIIELDRGLGRQAAEVGVQAAVTTQDVLQRAGYEEDLLDEAQLLAALGAVVRIEDLGDGLTRSTIADRIDVAAAVEGAEVELGRSLGFPEAEEVDAAAREAGDRDVPRHAEEVARLDEFGGVVAAVIGAMLDAAVERHAHAEVRAADQPRVIVGQPVVGDFDLATEREGLPEQTEFGMDAVADGRDVHRREGIQETGGQTAEAAVTETHVGFFVGDGLQVLAEFG